MSIVNKFRSAWRGDVSFWTLVREVIRRRRAAARRAAERRDLDAIAGGPARLRPEFASLSPGELLAHFRARPSAFFEFDGIGERARRLFPSETETLIENADRIVQESKWELAGFGLLEFEGDDVWRRDPLGAKDWGLDYHADVVVYSADAVDIRVLWELNRFGHAVALACAYAITDEESYAEAFFSQVEAWMEQNPYGRGANWNCAMETALRAINVLAAFDIFRRSDACTEDRLSMILRFCDQHGRFTFDNNEFSYLATSNHYLSDVVGLFWIGTILPELERAEQWREFGLSEMLREMDKQVLPDGADFEASTGYHNFVAQMLLYSFLLAQRNGIEIEEHYRQKLLSMFEYIHGVVRPDGRTPLIGDADGSQITPLVKRNSPDVAYLLAIAAVVFDEPKFQEFGKMAPEILWLLGDDGVRSYDSMEGAATRSGSASFPNGGAYVMRDGDLYLYLNANDTGINGRGSHAHNDALSIEVSAFGRPFIVDPGSYVYNLDREARHQFRSTAIHSTVTIDGEEQNTMSVDLPFILGNQAQPKILEWTTASERDVVSAEHYGYARLRDPVVHRRTIEFDKIDRYWTVIDKLSGKATHDIAVSFHLAPGVSAEAVDRTARLSDVDGHRLFVQLTGIDGESKLVPSAVSRNYGHKEDSLIVRWRSSKALPATIRTVLLPVGPDEKLEERLELLNSFADNTGS